jgi:dolichol kinase
MAGGAGKSAAGSFAFFAVAVAVAFGGLYGAADFEVGEALAAALLVATITTGVEAILGDGLDNLFVPLGALASLELFAITVAAQP